MFSSSYSSSSRSSGRALLRTSKMQKNARQNRKNTQLKAVKDESNVVKSNKPANAPKDAFKALTGAKVLQVSSSDAKEVEVHSLFDPEFDTHVLVFMRSFG
jgi:hypothetical protein|tara:strand:- start:1469 stop:1771 length:303 start_codon:yes stop_codon:yes gene_type:complete